MLAAREFPSRRSVCVPRWLMRFRQATTLRHIAKTLGKKLREELSGVGTEWEWTPLERGEVVEHLRICEAGPLPPRKPKQVVVAPVVVEKQREEDSERDSVASDASRTEGRRIGRRKAVGASVALLKGKGAVAAAATLKKKEMEKRKRARSESTSEKDETPNFEGASSLSRSNPH